MKLPPLVHRTPAGLRDAVDQLAEAAPWEAVPLAGGQSLVPLLASRARRAHVLVDLAGVPELSGLTERDGFLTVGAMTRQHTLAADVRVRAAAPLLATAAGLTGHASVRHRGTLGGTLAFAAPVAQLLTAAYALDARLHLTGPGGDRQCALRTWITGPYTTRLGPAELLTAVTLPVRREGCGYALLQVGHPTGGRPLACVAAVVDTTDDGTVRRAELTVATRKSPPATVDVTDRLDEAADAAAATVAVTAEPDDNGPPASYCRRAARTLARRALTEAIGRARRPAAVPTSAPTREQP
ncbi:FAD binding domain-containing protein [Streptomyces sp. NPDC058954]|uniref:FAD binding domain-containing protein n=1 Tax=Streptomyces sp. NPDC058954 TaxID=3346677 RepID=UPI0036A7BBAA